MFLYFATSFTTLTQLFLAVYSGLARFSLTILGLLANLCAALAFYQINKSAAACVGVCVCV